MPATLTAIAADTPNSALRCDADAVTWSSAYGPACWVCGQAGTPDIVVDVECDEPVMLSSTPVWPQQPDIGMFRAEIRHHYSIGAEPF